MRSVKLQKHRFLEDGALNAFVDSRAVPYWMSLEEQRFYLLDNFDRYYSKPNTYIIETTPFCNLKCVKCPHHSMRLPRPAAGAKPLPGQAFMTLEEWKYIIDMVSEVSRNAPQPPGIFPAVRGECLMNKDIIPMVAYAANSGHIVKIITNGNLLTEDKAKGLIDAGLGSIIFSLDAVNESQYDKLQPGGSYRDVVRNIERLLKLRGGMKRPSVGVLCCQTPENQDDFQEYLRRWEGQVDTVTASVCYDIEKGFRPWKVFYPVADRYPCIYLWGSMLIHADGGMALCGIDVSRKYNLGNIFKGDLLSIWNSEKIHRLREYQMSDKRKEGLCQECICWTNPYFIEKIDGDRSWTIGPQNMSISHYRPKPLGERAAVRTKKLLLGLGVPSGIIGRLRKFYFKLGRRH
ncbi:MAG: radical SAM protein [Pseudomonadota bacterium]